MMQFSLIVCTYLRPKALITLLESVALQTLYPNEILIIDGSITDDSEKALQVKNFKNCKYYRASENERGLTNQRNVGIKLVADTSDILCFLDDDVVLEPDYFEKLIQTYSDFPAAIGVGGYITNEVNWENTQLSLRFDEFEWDGYKRKLGTRNVIRKYVKLLSTVPPGWMPEFSHGFSISYLPPSNKCYEVEYFMGGVASYRRKVFESFVFSAYFKGYGLYEDLDFCVRIAKTGKLFVNTAARLAHYHEPLGRPNTFNYGKMVVRNGWYVWRVKYENPSYAARIKWHLITILLLKLRLINSITAKNKKDTFYEAIGRLWGWFSLILNKPKK
jgi:GT2 family glycosyltransferase